jgi:hypothetical protein
MEKEDRQYNDKNNDPSCYYLFDVVGDKKKSLLREINKFIGLF